MGGVSPMGLITLLTDFGHKDCYVGVMKGVIASISPQSRVIDLTHDIEPQAVLAARFNLLMGYGYFPVGTVHVVVVDPGVGTQRTAIATHINTPTGQQTVVAPDNGILTGFCMTSVVALTNTSYWRIPQPSHTFHGRDIFAPVAAHLANGLPLAALGPALSVDSLVRLEIRDAIAPALTGQFASTTGYSGSIQYIDRFGNLVTNISGDQLPQQPWYVQVGKQLVPHHTTYGHTEPGTALALIGSHGYVEIAVNAGNAAQVFKTQVGDTVDLSTYR